MTNRTKDNLFSGIPLLIASVILTVLIVTKPDNPPPEYWVKFGVAILAWGIMLTAMPFMRQLANIKATPETWAKPIIVAILIIFLLIVLGAGINALIGMNIPLFLFFGFFAFTIIRLTIDYAKSKRKK